MITVLLWAGIVAVYLLGYVPTAVMATRTFGTLPYCHKDNDHQRGYCLKHHRRFDDGACWRSDPTEIGMSAAVNGSLIALFWPFAIVPFAVLALATRERQVKQLLTPAELKVLERSAGISDAG